jgi:phosphoribosyl 1,2-cyclic phosphodiesterase
MKALKFWGTRGSCSVSGPGYQHFGGNTSCLELCYKEQRIIIDAGTGIRPLGETLRNQERVPINIFLTHTHWDHVMGFPFFEPLGDPEQKITIWSPVGSGRPTHELFNQLLAPEFFPVSLESIKAQLIFRTLEPKKTVQMGPLGIDFHPTHHKGLTVCFKIKTGCEVIGYVTDNEFLHGYHGGLDTIEGHISKADLNLVEFLSECDLLIHEAQYFPEEYKSKVGWGHSSLLNTIALIQQTKVKRWLVMHHDPSHTDKDLKALEQMASKILEQHKIACRAQWIGDGFVLELK